MIVDALVIGGCAGALGIAALARAIIARPYHPAPWPLTNPRNPNPTTRRHHL